MNLNKEKLGVKYQGKKLKIREAAEQPQWLLTSSIPQSKRPRSSLRPTLSLPVSSPLQSSRSLWLVARSAL